MPVGVVRLCDTSRIYGHRTDAEELLTALVGSML